MHLHCCAIKLNPKLALAYSNRGNVYYAKGAFDRAIADYTKAIADFRKALEINPSNQDAKEGLKRLGVTP